MNNNKIRNVRVWLKSKGQKKYIIGQYHPNVQTIYVTEKQFNEAQKRFMSKDVIPDNNIAKVKIIKESGITSYWN